MGDRRNLGSVAGRQWLAHRVGVTVLEGHQPGDRFVRVERVAERTGDVGRIEGPVGQLLERPDRRADDHRVAGRLVDDHVMLAAGDRLLAPAQVRHLGDEVAHRARGDEQAGFLAEQLRGSLLEGSDGRIVAEDVVADLCVGHGTAHLGGRTGDGVGAEIEESHRPRSIGEAASRPVVRGDRFLGTPTGDQVYVEHDGDRGGATVLA
jgi:hypothetical protein